MKYTFDEDARRLIVNAYDFAIRSGKALSTEHILLTIPEEKIAFDLYYDITGHTELPNLSHKLLSNICDKGAGLDWDEIKVGKDPVLISKEFSRFLDCMPMLKVRAVDLVQGITSIEECHAFQLLKVMECT